MSGRFCDNFRNGDAPGKCHNSAESGSGSSSRAPLRALQVAATWWTRRKCKTGSKGSPSASRATITIRRFDGEFRSSFIPAMGVEVTLGIDLVTVIRNYLIYNWIYYSSLSLSRHMDDRLSRLITGRKSGTARADRWRKLSAKLRSRFADTWSRGGFTSQAFHLALLSHVRFSRLTKRARGAHRFLPNARTTAPPRVLPRSCKEEKIMLYPERAHVPKFTEENQRDKMTPLTGAAKEVAFPQVVPVFV